MNSEVDAVGPETAAWSESDLYKSNTKSYILKYRIGLYSKKYLHIIPPIILENTDFYSDCSSQLLGDLKLYE